VGHPPRPNIPGAIYHVASRGTNKESIFFDDVDRAAFLALLARVAARHGWIILAYCLMTTHYHLVVKVPEGGLSAGMRMLNSGYSRRTNRRYGRTMHLFRQRFFSVQLESESHLFEAFRYVVLNPGRAGLCGSPAEWRWSSYRSCAGLDVPPSFLALGEVMSLFDRDLRCAAAFYRAFIQAGLSDVSDTGSEVRREAR
jgi:REP element-mobilizing transposase RayT